MQCGLSGAVAAPARTRPRRAAVAGGCRATSCPRPTVDALPQPAPEILRRFYGLVDGTPWTQQAIAEYLGLNKRQVQHILRQRQVTSLLGEPPRRADRRTVTANCAICGSAVQREGHALRDRVQTTCSPACRRELRRRHLATRPPLDRATRVKAGEAFRQKLASPEFRERWAAKQEAARRFRQQIDDGALRVLPADAFQLLDEQARELIRSYYGLDGAWRQTLRVLGRRFGMDGPQLRELILTGLERLLAARAEWPDAP